MKRFLLIPLLLALGCASTKVIRTEVPVPYWDPPKNVAELPDRYQLRSLEMAPEAAAEDTRAAFQDLLRDIAGLIEEAETVRHLYEALKERVEKEEPHEE
jgi:hypothetical protein